jgi:uncharacterized membrane protein YkgB
MQPARLYRTVSQLDLRATAFMARHGIQFLRVSLAIVFIWFGALKLVGRSPVADLVAGTLPWFLPEPTVIAIGVLEVLIGLGLLFRVALRATLLLFWLQMGGTFLVLVMQPGRAFQGFNPLLLTTEGEFVIKNLILISAGLVVGATARRRGAPEEREKIRAPGTEPARKSRLHARR